MQTGAVRAVSVGDVTAPLPAASSHWSDKQSAPLKTEADMAAYPEGPVGGSQKVPISQAAASKGNPLARGVQAIFDGYAGCCGRMTMHGEQPMMDVCICTMPTSHTVARRCAVKLQGQLLRSTVRSSHELLRRRQGASWPSRLPAQHNAILTCFAAASSSCSLLPGLGMLDMLCPSCWSCALHVTFCLEESCMVHTPHIAVTNRQDVHAARLYA